MRPARLLLRDAARDRRGGLRRAVVQVGRRGVDGGPRGEELARRAAGHIRAARRLVAARRRKHDARLARPRRGAAALPEGRGLHARRIHAGHGASVLRLVGLPDDGIFCADLALRLARGFYGARRRAAPRGHRRDTRLGSVALPDGRARPRALRRHRALRAQRPAPGLPPRLEERDIQLRAQRGAQLPRLVGELLARTLPRGRPARRRRRLDALPRLFAPRRRMGAEQVRRQGKLRGDRLPEGAQHLALRRAPRHNDDGGGVDLVADGDEARVARRPRLRG